MIFGTSRVITRPAFQLSRGSYTVVVQLPTVAVTIGEARVMSIEGVAGKEILTTGAEGVALMVEPSVMSDGSVKILVSVWSPATQRLDSESRSSCCNNQIRYLVIISHPIRTSKQYATAFFEIYNFWESEITMG